MKTTLCCSILVALAALSGTTQARSNYIPRTERGQLVANLVERWSPEAARRMKTTPGAWAGAMGSAFAKAPMEKLRRAVAAAKFEDMIGALDVSASSYNGSLVFHTITPCRLADTRLTTKMAGGETRMFKGFGLFEGQGGSDECAGAIHGSVALALKVTAVDSEGAGTLNVFAMGDTVTPSNALNFANQVVANHRVDVEAGPDFFVFANSGTHVVIDVVGWYDPASSSLKCRRTAEFGAYVLDGAASTIVNAPVCESHETQTATFCRSSSKSTVLLGTKDKECVFADATPNGVGGSAYAASQCCSVDTNY